MISSARTILYFARVRDMNTGVQVLVITAPLQETLTALASVLASLSLQGPYGPEIEFRRA